MDPVRVAYVYANSRSERVGRIAAGLEPDTSLLGQNHLAAHGIDSVAVEPILQRFGPRAGALGRLAWNVRELTLPLELHGIDVLCTTLGPPVAAAAHLRPKLRTVLLAINVCTRLDRAGRTQRALLARFVRNADAVVCFAEAQRDRLLEQTGADPGRVRVVPLGVDERFLTPTWGVPPDGPVLAVGRDLARDYATFCTAVEPLPARVVLVASEKNLGGIRLPPNVDLRLDVSAIELRELYNRARCVVIPTREESYPYGADCSGQTVLLDAWAMARPVVATERETLRGYVEPGRNALLVPTRDADALRTEIERLLADSSWASALGAAGRAAVEERFTTRALASGLATVFESVRRGGR